MYGISLGKSRTLCIFFVMTTLGMSLLAEHRYAPYWYLDGQTRTVLEIASIVDETRSFTPVLLIRGHETLTLESVTLRPYDTVRIDLRRALNGYGQVPTAEGVAKPHVDFDSPRPRSKPGRWGDGSRPGSLWGSALLMGEDFTGIYSWFVMEQPTSGLSVNSMFSGTHENAAKLTAMWWRPTPASQALLAMTNASTAEIVVDTWVQVEGESIPGKSFRMGAETGRLFKPEEILGLTGQQQLPELGAVYFKTRDGGHHLQGWTLLVDENRGFSTPLSMQSPDYRLSVDGHVPGSIMGKVGPDQGFARPLHFSPYLLLANITDQPVEVFLNLRGEGVALTPWELGHSDALEPQGPLGVWHAPVMALKPRETRLIDLGAYHADAGGDVPAGMVGVELSHSGNPGSLYSEVLTVDRELGYSFHDPFMDLERPPVSMTTVSFDLTQARNKLIVIKNTALEPNLYSLVLRFDVEGQAQKYRLLNALKPGEMISFNLKSLRDDQVPDSEGRLLPRDLTFGHITVRGRDPGVIAGDLAFDDQTSFASCFDPCECDPPGFWCQPLKNGHGQAKMVFICVGGGDPWPSATQEVHKWAIRYNLGNQCVYHRCTAGSSCVPSVITESNQPGTSCNPAGYQQTYWIHSNGICSTDGVRTSLSQAPCVFAKD